MFLYLPNACSVLKGGIIDYFNMICKNKDENYGQGMAFRIVKIIGLPD